MADPIIVTGCRIYLNYGADEHLKAFASIILNDAFAVCDLKVISGSKGLFVAMPSRRRKNGVFLDVAHPVTKELRMHIEQTVLTEYQRALEDHTRRRRKQPVQHGSPV
ncbi:MAG TPA: SpoVG family protein [Candidatus Sumerlaeota bacterium]|nr:MAG: putative septation protein SpoVG [candidate division BRC1 bacterium ADurb.BinA292]HOE95727.1 SpoVG family protein [Candidatus Sumerlaeota bacterium]HPK01693.1 SpoVG family protein [Candidatus Sumerlaeota bacterium]